MPQSAAAALMVRPARFGFNPQTSASNAFQCEPAPASAGRGPRATGQAAAAREFDAMAARLERHGVEVLVVQDGRMPPKPDAIFPNNWVSFHEDGTQVLYPMLAPNRREERRVAVLRAVARRFKVARTLDLSGHEAAGQYLEGTGSLVLDRVHRVAYACRSPRTHAQVLGEFAAQLDYEVVPFDAVDAAGRPVYHTNVVMAVGSGFAVICAASIADPRGRAEVLRALRAGGRKVLAISLQQMHRFAGNLLELATPDGALIAASATAWDSLEPAQRKFLEGYGNVVPFEIPSIERLGGGSVRCMLAEIHLPRP